MKNLKSMFISKSVSETILRFQVKGSNDAHVLFSSCDGCDGYEIVIGGWNNSQSVIRQSKQVPNPGYNVTSTPDVLSVSEYRGFWISLKLEDKVSFTEIS